MLRQTRTLPKTRKQVHKTDILTNMTALLSMPSKQKASLDFLEVLWYNKFNQIKRGFIMKFKDMFWVLFISMVPIIELRGAIPVGASLGLPFYANYAVATLGNLLPVPFILLLIPHILNFMERFKIFKPIVKWVRKKAMKNSKKISADTASSDATVSEAKDSAESTATNKKMQRSAFLGLLLFVLLPLPGTGAWTGSLVASLFNFPKLKSFIAIALGVFGCGVIMCLASYGILGFLSFLA